MEQPEPAAGLPPTVAKAWGLEEPRGKGPRPGLTLDRVVDAAVGVARAEGLAAVSMARVAAALGVSTMALYRYVSGKTELLTLMVDHAWGPPPEPAAAGGWRPRLEHWARAMLASMAKDAWAVGVPISSAPATPNAVAWMDACVAALDGTGLDYTERASVLLLLSGYVRNQVALGASLAAAATTDPDAVALMRDYSRVLARVADPVRFPALAAAVAAGAFDDDDTAGDEGLDAEFSFGLERILDGIEVLVRERDPGAADGVRPVRRSGAGS
jgi:AcrR family transcriptional regulator